MFLDIGLGIIFSVLVSKYFLFQLDWLFVLSGIFFALLPDSDFLIFLSKGGKAGKEAHFHRDLLHRPPVYIIVGFLILLPFSKPLALLFILASLGHFIHDSTAFGLGWGIRFFYPFSKNYFMFFRFRVGSEKKFPFRLVHNLNREEMKEMGEKYGDRNG